MTAQFTATIEYVAQALAQGIVLNEFVRNNKAVDVDDLVAIIIEVEPYPIRRTQILEAVKMVLQKNGIEILDSKTDPTGKRSKA